MQIVGLVISWAVAIGIIGIGCTAGVSAERPQARQGAQRPAASLAAPDGGKADSLDRPSGAAWEAEAGLAGPESAPGGSGPKRLVALTSLDDP
jgi:hypothetical protein